MLPDKTRITEFLKKSHLFRGMSDEQLSLVSSEMEGVSYQAGDLIYNEAEKSNYFYLVYSGNVRLSCDVGDEDTEVAIMSPGEFFGEEVLNPDRPRSESASALDEVSLIRISQQRHMA